MGKPGDHPKRLPLRIARHFGSAIQEVYVSSMRDAVRGIYSISYLWEPVTCSQR
jgi:hypothetical protein